MQSRGSLKRPEYGQQIATGFEVLSGGRMIGGVERSQALVDADGVVDFNDAGDVGST